MCRWLWDSPNYTTHIFFDCPIYRHVWVDILCLLDVGCPLANNYSTNVLQFDGLVLWVNFWEKYFIPFGLHTFGLFENQIFFKRNKVIFAHSILAMVKYVSYLWIKFKEISVSYDIDIQVGCVWVRYKMRREQNYQTNKNLISFIFYY